MKPRASPRSSRCWRCTGQSRALFKQIAEHHIILTTYALLPRDLKALSAHSYRLLILDEAQNIKTRGAKPPLPPWAIANRAAPVPDRHAAGKSPGRTVVAVQLPHARLARRQ